MQMFGNKIDNNSKRKFPIRFIGNTKIVTQRAVMGANITNKLAQQVYMNNGNLVVESFVKWENNAEACYAGYTLNGVVDGKEHSIKISSIKLRFLRW